MKKLPRIFSLLLLLLLFSSTMVVQAKSPQLSKPSPEEKINAFLSQIEQKQSEHMDAANEKFLEKDAQRDARNEAFLEIIKRYLPDMYDDFQNAMAQHDALHIALFDKRTGIRLDYQEELNDSLATLKVDLLEQLATGAISQKEAKAQLKTLIFNSTEAFKSHIAAYEEAIAAEKAEWEASAIELKRLHEVLNEAVTAGNTQNAAEIIADMYDIFIQHIAFDQFKLDTMNSMF